MNTPFTPEQVIEMVNQYREEAGLPRLKTNPKLMKAAQERAKDMATTGVFSHGVATSTLGMAWDHFIRKAGYDYPYIGENLAKDFKDATSTVEAWKKSPDHNFNLTRSSYTDTGVAIIPGMKDGKQTYYVVQMMGGPGQTPIKTMPIASSTPANPQMATTSPPQNLQMRIIPNLDMRTKTTTPQFISKKW